MDQFSRRDHDAELGEDVGADSDLYPELDPHAEAEISALLRQTPTPGPMPQEISDRITAALADEARLRLDRGPLSPGAQTMYGAPEVVSADPKVVSLASRRRRPLIAVASVAAAAAVVAVGGSVLHLNKRDAASANVGLPQAARTSTFGDANAKPEPGSTGLAEVPKPGQVPLPSSTVPLHIQQSDADYRAGSFAEQAAAMADSPGPGLPTGVPGTVGPIGTEVGVLSCLTGLGNPARDKITVDLASFSGQPAAIIVLSAGGKRAAYVVERRCSADDPAIIIGQTPLP